MKIRFVLAALVAVMLVGTPLHGHAMPDEEPQEVPAILEDGEKQSEEQVIEPVIDPAENKIEQQEEENTNEQKEQTPEPEKLSASEMGKYESSGSYSTIIGGSLGKALWKDQDRENITPLLKTLKSRHEFPGMTEFKKRLLLTAADMSDVDGPEEIAQGDDFLTLRLEKLIENGWYDEAYKLYTDSVENPPHERLAEIGILLILYNGDLPTACLEEKVIAANFMHTDFFKTLDSACAIELGMSEDMAPLHSSETLTSVFADESFYIPALDTNRLLALSPLERGLVFAKGRIRYDVNLITPEIIDLMPSRMLMLYRRDKNLPEELKEPLLREALVRDLITRDMFRKKSGEYQKIGALEDEDTKIAAIADKLSTESSLPVLAAYTPLFTPFEPTAPSEQSIHKIVAAFLYADKDIPDFWKEQLEQLSGSKAKNYVYLQLVSALTGNLEKSQLLAEEEETLPLPRDFGQVLAIFGSLDIKKMLDEKVLIVYEKQSSLTEATDYGMNLSSLEKDIKTPANEEHSGLTVLNVLKALDGRLTDTPPSLISVALSSLKNVGYIDDVRAIAKKAVAEIIINNEGE